VTSERVPEQAVPIANIQRNRSRLPRLADSDHTFVVLFGKTGCVNAIRDSQDFRGGPEIVARRC